MFACPCLPVHWVKFPTQKVATRKRHRDQKLQRGQLNDGILLKQRLSTKSRHDMTPPINQHPLFQKSQDISRCFNCTRSSSKDTNPSTHSSKKNPQKNVRPKESPTTRHSILIYYMNYTQYILNISPTLDFHSNKGGSLPVTTFLGTKLMSLIMWLPGTSRSSAWLWALRPLASMTLAMNTHIFARGLEQLQPKSHKGGGTFLGGKPCESDLQVGSHNPDFSYEISGLLFPSCLLWNPNLSACLHSPNLWAPHNLSSCTASVFSWPINIKASKSGSPIELELQLEQKSSEIHTGEHMDG